jgi:hypothetical protein
MARRLPLAALMESALRDRQPIENRIERRTPIPEFPPHRFESVPKRPAQGQFASERKVCISFGLPGRASAYWMKMRMKTRYARAAFVRISNKTPEATGERGKTPEAIASIFELANASPILHEDAGFAKA